MEDDITADGAKVARRTATSDKVAEGRAPGAQGSEGGKAIPATAVKILLPALKELLQGMGTQYDLLKEVVAAVQARPWPSSQTCLLLGSHACSKSNSRAALACQQCKQVLVLLQFCISLLIPGSPDDNLTLF